MTMHVVHVSQCGCLLMHNMGGFFECCFELVWGKTKLEIVKVKGCNILKAVLRFLGQTSIQIALSQNCRT